LTLKELSHRHFGYVKNVVQYKSDGIVIDMVYIPFVSNLAEKMGLPIMFAQLVGRVVREESQFWATGLLLF